jgi:hypothetical protein
MELLVVTIIATDTIYTTPITPTVNITKTITIPNTFYLNFLRTKLSRA